MNFKMKLSNEVMVDFRKSPHQLVAGVTGAGKTGVLLTTILRSATSKSVVTNMIGMCADVYICDGKKSDLYSLRHILPRGKVVSSPREVAKLLRIMDENMKLRYENFNGNFGEDLSSYNIDGKIIRPIVIVIDELAILLNSSAKKDIEEHLFNLLTGGRQSLIFVVVGIARPSSDIVSRNTTLNFNTRILLNSNSADNDSKRMMFPMTDIKTLPTTDGSKGSGIIFEEGMDWIVPRPINFPNIYSLNIPNILKRIQSEINPNWFIKEDYWKAIG